MNWEDWLYEDIVFDGLVTCPRWKAIKLFVRDGLVPFLKRHGYVIGVTEQQLCSNLATGLFVNAKKSCLESNWKFGQVNVGSLPEYQRLHYFHTVDSDEWDNFWTAWGKWDDVCEESQYGSDRRYDIQDYCWSQLSPTLSPEIQNLEDVLSYSEDGGRHYMGNSSGAASHAYTASNYGKNDDVYLREAAEY
jgi:hypothetical protein